MAVRVRSQDVAAIGSDPDVLERFYREHVDAVQRFVARRVDDPHRAADLTADVFLAAIEAAGSYSPRRGEPIAWLHGIARNVMADEWRHDVKERRAASRLAGRALVDEEDLSRLHERLDAESGARALYRELGRVSPGDRAVLELVALDGLGVGEAARALGIGAVTARVRLHRARRALRARLPRFGLDLNDQAEVAS